MNRNNKARGTLHKGPPEKPNNTQGLLGQMLFETRTRLQLTEADAMVAKTMLAAVLASVVPVTIRPETIELLQGKPFIIEKTATAAGGLIVRSIIPEEPLMAAEILVAENEGMVP